MRYRLLPNLCSDSVKAPRVTAWPAIRYFRWTGRGDAPVPYGMH
jgi:hypothetical protein